MPVSSEKAQNKLFLPRPVDKEFKISSGFGERSIFGGKGFHNGYDFACPEGTKVYAIADGSIFKAGWQNDSDHKEGYGLRVWQEIEVSENENTKTRYYIWYGHLSKLLVKDWERVKKGQEIGFSGNTGKSTGPHLHIGARKRDHKDFTEIEFI